MRTSEILDLNDCSEFRQALRARPPRFVHGSAVLLALLVGAALLWVALTRVDLVVRAEGRVRPVNTPARVFVTGSPDSPASGRVAEVRYREGQRVHAGDVLVRLDAERLDNEVAKRQRTLQAGEEELAKLAQMEQTLKGQYQAGRAKLEAELAQAEDEVRRDKERRASDLRLAQTEYDHAAGEEARLRRLVERQAASLSEAQQAAVRLREAKEKLAKAKLPVEEARLEVLRRALTLAEKDDAVKREELEMKRGLKRAEVEAARLELANLELERKQAVLVAPTDGVVISQEVKVGDLLERGRPVVEIAEENGLVFEAAVPSEEVGHLKAGLPARVKVDAYDYQKYGTLAGEVAFVSPDSGVPEAAAAKGHAVYLVKVALDGDEVGRGALRGKLRLGMGGRVEVVTEQESLLLILVKQIRRSISLG